MNWMSQTPSLQSLDQWNCEQGALWADKLGRAKNPEGYPNGLICPKDGGRLYDTGQQFTGPPAMLRVKCMNKDCNFRGERYARVNRVLD